MTYSTLDNQWSTYLAGSGSLEQVDRALRFRNVDTTTGQMTNAQIDDYQGLRRRAYLWRPPLTLTVRARFSHPDGVLSGTAGFGFWNDPFLMTRGRTPALPRALWFFYASPPSDMRLAQDVPGRGWKAAAIDATRPRALLWAPLAPVLVPLMNVQPIYRRLWPYIQRSLGISEAPIEADMQDWHTYTLDWQVFRARFSADGTPVLDCAAPRGPLGFVAWLDNQYMVVTPWGRFGYGWLDAPEEQWMEIEDLEIAGSRHSCVR